MNKERIKYKDPFLGEIELESLGQVVLDAFLNTETYFYHTDERFKKRGLDAGVYIRYDATGEIKFLRGKQIEMITRIYDKLTRI
jgi:hypothetical protein